MSVIRVPRKGSTQEHRDRRQQTLHRQGIHWQQQTTMPQDLNGLIENHIGYVGLPLAVAGPCQISGTYAKGSFYIPLAVMEGSLVMSMERGLFAAARSGGIQSVHIQQEISRSPMFTLTSIETIPAFMAWIDDHFAAIKQQAESTTRHGKLLRIDQYPMHNRVILDCVFSTAEAAGQNMITLATKAACDWILSQAKASCAIDYYVIESNFNGDKNSANRNMLLGRGHKVIASAVISNKVLRRVMHITPNELVKRDIVRSIGSQLAGLNGHHLHLANALTAIYVAVGQDAACVVENAVGTVTNEVTEDGDLATYLTLPSLTLGTVGGATRLPQQQQNLRMLGCTGVNSSKKLAEIVAAACLGLELSLACAIATNEFAVAHKHYGR